MWIIPLLLLFVQHSTGSSTVIPPNEQSQCNSYCPQQSEKCEESSKTLQEKNQQLTRLKAQLTVYQDKVRQMELQLNYSNTNRENLLESHKIQSESEQRIEQIIGLQSTIMECLKQNSTSEVIKQLEQQLENQDLAIKENASLLKLKQKSIFEYVQKVQNMSTEWVMERYRSQINTQKLLDQIDAKEQFIVNIKYKFIELERELRSVKGKCGIDLEEEY